MLASDGQYQYPSNEVEDTLCSSANRSAGDATPLKIAEAGLLVTPNPADQLINLYFDTDFTGTIQLYSVTGQLLYTNMHRNTRMVSLESASWPGGVYFLRCTAANSHSQFKELIIKH